MLDCLTDYNNIGLNEIENMSIRNIYDSIVTKRASTWKNIHYAILSNYLNTFNYNLV